jgi:hypothetical protein
LWQKNLLKIVSVLAPALLRDKSALGIPLYRAAALEKHGLGTDGNGLGLGVIAHHDGLHAAVELLIYLRFLHLL